MKDITDTEMCEALVALYRALHRDGCPDAALAVAMEQFSLMWEEADRSCHEPHHISLDKIRERQRQRSEEQRAELLTLLEELIPDDDDDHRD